MDCWLGSLYQCGWCEDRASIAVTIQLHETRLSSSGVGLCVFRGWFPNDVSQRYCGDACERAFSGHRYLISVAFTASHVTQFKTTHLEVDTVCKSWRIF